MNNTELVKKSLGRRYRKEKRFRLYGMLAVFAGISFLGILLADIGAKSLPAWYQNYVKLDVSFDPDVLGVPENATPQQLQGVGARSLLKKSVYAMFPDVTDRKEKRALGKLVSSGAEYALKDMLVEHPEWLGTTQTVEVLLDDDIDSFIKSEHLGSVAEADRRVKDNQAGWVHQLEEQGRITSRFGWNFFTNGDSREPEQAGIAGALMGSLFTVLVTLLLSFPLGVAAAVYLEEFAPQNRITDLIEININNLAAVPSIVFGLLGLAVFINFFGLPRSAPLVGGMVLTLMTLPTIIISSRAAIKAVPPSITEAALGLGASKMQTVFQHIVPLAMPGMLTGAIIGMAQALGESAPLLMIGMVAFIVDVPHGALDPATVMPVQIYLWSDSPERAFVAKTSAAIIVLLAFLVTMNMLAIYLRSKFEKKW